MIICYFVLFQYRPHIADISRYFDVIIFPVRPQCHVELCARARARPTGELRPRFSWTATHIWQNVLVWHTAMRRYEYRRIYASSCMIFRRRLRIVYAWGDAYALARDGQKPVQRPNDGGNSPIARKAACTPRLIHHRAMWARASITPHAPS